VEGGTPDVIGGFLVIVCGLDTLVYETAIVVPDHELDVGEAGFFEGGTEEVLDEVTLFIGGEDAGFPDLDGKRLILNSQAPHGKAYDGLEGLFVVNDDRGNILVRLIERREGKETAVGEQLCGDGCRGWESCVGRGGGARRCRDVNAGFPVIPFLGGG